MRWLTLCFFLSAATAAIAETAATVTVCYDYGCLVEEEVNYAAAQLAEVRALLGAAGSAAEERDRLSQAVGWLLGWAGQQTPIVADRGGNVADSGVYGRMDCIDHATTTTRLLRLLENRGWLQFHRVLEPVRRIRYLVAVHFSAQIEEFAPAANEPQRIAAEPDNAGEPARFVVDSWFRDNGQPAVVLPLANWLDGEGEEETERVAVVARRPDDGQPIER
ncbi:MAG: hypothetical protein IPJ27_04160 [Candidatus Accumulibacter sp.]|uniref:Uncharacterized protein n=1 Tax=Candidatus Accumulibacter proximus TaxID=2954385 RepID=A0A935PY13_9PROT|nr:hypothetical protein [Candidatus Accumulibacter proximus]